MTAGRKWPTCCLFVVLEHDMNRLAGYPVPDRDDRPGNGWFPFEPSRLTPPHCLHGWMRSQRNEGVNPIGG